MSQKVIRQSQKIVLFESLIFTLAKVGLVMQQVFLMGKPDMITSERLWYKLLTKEEFFRHCINIDKFALCFLVCTFNECSVEAQVSSIESI